MGEILIDDVYSGGTSKEAERTGHTLLSEAMADGFLHPRCQDAFTTYFEGVSTPPEQEQVTADEEQTIKENNRLKQKQQYHKLMAKKCHRIADNSLAEDNKRIYTARATEHTKVADKIGEKITDEPVEKSDKSGIIKLKMNLFDTNDPLYIDTFSIEEEAGFEDICIHGSEKSVQTTVDGMLTNFTPEEFAEYIKKNGYKGGNIRLASCSTGKGDNSFAQRLSKVLGVIVKAPDNDIYYAIEEGTYFIGAPTFNLSSWRLFNNGVEI